MTTAVGKTQTSSTKPQQPNGGDGLTTLWLSAFLLLASGNWWSATSSAPLPELEYRNGCRENSIELNDPQLCISGRGEVLKALPCPPIPPRPNSQHCLVTTKFEHEAANALNLTIADLNEPIGITANHPFWSTDRQAFVQAGDLQIGEKLLTDDDTLTHVVAITQRLNPETVFNLEVDGERVYYVSAKGILVHNSYNDFALGMQRGGLARFARRSNAAYMSNFAERGLITNLEKAGERASFEILFPRIVNQTVQLGGRVRFDLTGVNIRNALVSRAGPSDAGYTAWELRMIVKSKEWLRNTVFYLNGRRLSQKEVRRLLQ